MRNPCLDAALAELDAVGIRNYQLARPDRFRDPIGRPPMRWLGVTFMSRRL